MAESSENNHENIVDQAVQQFLDAQLQGQEPNIDEFVKSYPGLEHQIRQKIEKIQKIDGLFSCLMQSDDSDFSETIAEHDLVGQKLGDFEVLSLIDTGGLPKRLQTRSCPIQPNVVKVQCTTLMSTLNKARCGAE